jgi:hypothetical protein
VVDIFAIEDDPSETFIGYHEFISGGNGGLQSRNVVDFLLEGKESVIGHYSFLPHQDVNSSH